MVTIQWLWRPVAPRLVQPVVDVDVGIIDVDS
jgi:hypothetical protein